MNLPYRKCFSGIVLTAALIFLCSQSLQGGPDGTPKPKGQKCTPTPDPAPRELLLKQRNLENVTADGLDRIQKHLEEWGTINISDPLLIPVGDQFDLGAELNFATTGTYINTESSQISAAAAQFNQSALVGQLSGSLTQPSATGGSGGAGGSGGSGGSAGSSGGVTTTTTTTTSTGGGSSGGGAAGGGSSNSSGTGLPSENAKDFLAQQAFAAANSLVPGIGSIPERDAVNSGIGDKITEKTLRLLTNASQLKTDTQYRYYYLTFQVTCNPGWRTLKDYMGDLQIQFEYGRRRQKNSRLEDYSLTVDFTQPTVVAALPLLSAQNIELRNSQRQLTALASALSAAGPTSLGTASGHALLDYIKSYQSDAASRHAMPVVNSYTAGRMSGFRFSPSFLATGNASKKQSKSENQLIPSSFPVVLLVKMDRKEAASYTQLISHYSYRWMPREHDISLLSLFPWQWKFPKRRDSERSRVQLARDADQSLDELIDTAAFDKCDLQMPDPTSRSITFRSMRKDYWELTSKALGGDTISPLPPDLKAPVGPNITAVYPQVLDPDMDTVLVIKGADFGPTPIVVVGGRRCDVVSVVNEQYSHSIVAQLPKGSLADTLAEIPLNMTKPSEGATPRDGSVDLVVVTDGGISNNCTLTVRHHDDGTRLFYLYRDIPLTTTVEMKPADSGGGGTGGGGSQRVTGTTTTTTSSRLEHAVTILKFREQGVGLSDAISKILTPVDSSAAKAPTATTPPAK